MKWLKRVFTRKSGPSTTDERFKAAAKLLRNTAPETLQDVMLLIAMESPMTLVQLLSDAGATVIQNPTGSMSVPPTTDAVN